MGAVVETKESDPGIRPRADVEPEVSGPRSPGATTLIPSARETR